MEQLDSTTFGLTQKADTLDSIRTEIGDSKQRLFYPQAKLIRWDNEVNFSFRHVETDAETPVISMKDGIVIYAKPAIEIHQYSQAHAGEDGGIEFEWLLKERPLTPYLQTTIQTKGLEFHYQAPPTREEAASGLTRPENALGSYAVYHATRGGVVDAYGQDYKTGKFCHIYRPKAIDARGAEVWCTLSIDIALGLLTVTVPKDFLDSAQYPIRVDPTFGFTSVGVGSTGWQLNGFINMGRYSIPENGTGVSISIFINTSSGGTIACNMYQDETGSGDLDVALLASGVTATIPGSTGWKTVNFTAPPIFTAGTFYRMAGWSDNGNNLNSDSVAGNHLYFKAIAFGAWPNPSGALTEGGTTERLSIYGTYTQGYSQGRIVKKGAGRPRPFAPGIAR